MGVSSIKQNEDEYLVDYGKKRLIHPTRACGQSSSTDISQV